MACQRAVVYSDATFAPFAMVALGSLRVHHPDCGLTYVHDAADPALLTVLESVDVRAVPVQSIESDMGVETPFGGSEGQFYRKLLMLDYFTGRAIQDEDDAVLLSCDADVLLLGRVDTAFDAASEHSLAATTDYGGTCPATHLRWDAGEDLIMNACLADRIETCPHHLRADLEAHFGLHFGDIRSSELATWPYFNAGLIWTTARAPVRDAICAARAFVQPGRVLDGIPGREQTVLNLACYCADVAFHQLQPTRYNFSMPGTIVLHWGASNHNWGALTRHWPAVEEALGAIGLSTDVLAPFVSEARA